MKKLLIAILFTALCVTSGFAQNKTFTGKDWVALTQKQKIDAVSDFISDAKKQGVAIKNDAIFYCKRMDSFYAKNPRTLGEAPGEILKTLMIMEYDWKVKGSDPEMTAKNWLGDKLYADNKKRLGKK